MAMFPRENTWRSSDKRWGNPGDGWNTQQEARKMQRVQVRPRPVKPDEVRHPGPNGVFAKTRASSFSKISQERKNQLKSENDQPAAPLGTVQAMRTLSVSAFRPISITAAALSVANDHQFPTTYVSDPKLPHHEILPSSGIPNTASFAWPKLLTHMHFIQTYLL
jgi:hypothetical protein